MTHLQVTIWLFLHQLLLHSNYNEISSFWQCETINDANNSSSSRGLPTNVASNIERN